MTVLDVTEKLYEWFSSNDAFVTKDNFKQIIPISEDEEKDKACVVAALKELVVHEMVVQEGEFWILKRAYSSFEQTVTIHPPLAHAIAEEINIFCDVIKDDTDRCDPGNLRDRDIGNVLMLYKSLKPKEGEEGGIESWFSSPEDDQKKK